MSAFCVASYAGHSVFALECVSRSSYELFTNLDSYGNRFIIYPVYSVEIYNPIRRFQKIQAEREGAITAPRYHTRDVMAPQVFC